MIQEAAPTSLEEISTPFGYLFGELKDEYPAAHLPVEPASTVVAGLKALGSAMVDAPPDGDPNSTIPPVYTYWGQFVDHDVTANTDRNDVVSIVGDPLTPIEPDLVPGTLRNLREPSLNLDSVYGNGPGAPDVDDEVPYDGIKLRTGALTVLNLPIFAAVPGGGPPAGGGNRQGPASATRATTRTSSSPSCTWRSSGSTTRSSTGWSPTSPSCATTTPASPAPESSRGGTTRRSWWRTSCGPSR